MLVCVTTMDARLTDYCDTCRQNWIRIGVRTPADVVVAILDYLVIWHDIHAAHHPAYAAAAARIVGVPLVEKRNQTNGELFRCDHLFPKQHCVCITTPRVFEFEQSPEIALQLIHSKLPLRGIAADGKAVRIWWDGMAGSQCT